MNETLKKCYKPAVNSFKSEPQQQTTKMLRFLENVDRTSKKWAFRAAVVNLVQAFVFTALLTLIIGLIFYYYDKTAAAPVCRFMLVEVVLNLFMLPFAAMLIWAVQKDQLRWINVWIKAKIVQTIYVLFLNMALLVYIITKIDVVDGIAVVLYTFVVEGVYMYNIIFMQHYCIHQASQEILELPKKEKNLNVITV